MLLDTHIVFWWMDGTLKSRYPTFFNRLVKTIENGQVFMSSISIWEMILKLSRHDTKTDVEKFLSIVDQFPFKSLSLERHHAEYSSQLPMHHKDPFDRMLVAQAGADGLILATKDPEIWQYEDHVTLLKVRA